MTNLEKAEKQIDIVWKDVIGFEGLYLVSSKGDVRSLDRIQNSALTKSKTRLKRGRILKSYLDTKGYPQVVLYHINFKKHINVHKIVAMAFLGHVPDWSNNIVVDHINGIKYDNDYKNLQIVTQSQNMRKAKNALNVSCKERFIYWSKDKRKWIVKIYNNTKSIYVGSYKISEDAILARDNYLAGLI